MTPRSPWRNASIKTCFGEDLPPLLRHHRYRDQPVHRRFWPISNSLETNKPQGGLWAAPALLPEGKWRPIPRRSSWTQWCETEMPEWINGRWQTQLFPRRDAVFAVIGSAADAVALYEAFPHDDHPLREYLMSKGLGGLTLYKKMIDWSRLMSRHIAGVYLTEQGQWETHLPDKDVVPSLYGWDCASVWFTHGDAYTVGRTRMSPPIPADPYGYGDGGDVDLGEAAAELIGRNAALVAALEAYHSRDVPALGAALAELRRQLEEKPDATLAAQVETLQDALEFLKEMKEGGE